MGMFITMLTHYATFEKVQVKSKGDDIRIIPESIMDLEIEKVVMMGDLYGRKE